MSRDFFKRQLFDGNVQHVEFARLHQFKNDARNREEMIFFQHGDDFRRGDFGQESFHEQAESVLRQLFVETFFGFDETQAEQFKIAARLAEAENSRAVPENFYEHKSFVVRKNFAVVERQFFRPKRAVFLGKILFEKFFELRFEIFLK